MENDQQAIKEMLEGRTVSEIRDELRAEFAVWATSLSQQLEAKGDYANAVRALKLASQMFDFIGKGQS